MRDTTALLSTVAGIHFVCWGFCSFCFLEMMQGHWQVGIPSSIYAYYCISSLLLGDTSINQLLKWNMPVSMLQTHSVSVPLHMSLHSVGNIISSPTHSELLWCLRQNMSTSTFRTYSISLCICHHCCTSTIVLLFHCSHFVYNSELILAEDPSYSFRTSC